MSQKLKITLLFWLNLLVSPIYIYFANGFTFFQLFKSGSQPFVKPSLMPGLIGNTFLFSLLISYPLVGLLTEYYFGNQPIMKSASDRVTIALIIIGSLLLLGGVIVKLMTGEAVQIAVVVNDFSSVIALTSLVWRNYKFWKSTNSKWVFLGLLIQGLCVCLFMEGFYSSIW